MKQTNAFLCLLAAIFALTLAACPDSGGGGDDPGTVATPTASPAAGAVASGTTVTLTTATTGATIYYTTDGSTTPTASSTQYTAPIAITAATTIKAIAVKSGMTNSGVLTAAYTIDASKVATPTASPAAGAVASGTTVALATATTGATIYYTTNGDTPTASSTTYTTPIAITAATTIKAIAVKSGMTNSAVLEASYTVAAPAFTGYIITGSGTAFTATKGGTPVTNADGVAIADVLTAIRTDANNAACEIQFGDGTATLNIGTATAQFNTTGGTWGAVTLSGKITSAITTSNSGTIHIVGAVSVTTTADIANTGNDNNSRAVYNASTATLTISGGTISATTGSAVYNGTTCTVNITDGTLTAPFFAVYNSSGSPTVNISGGSLSGTGSNGQAVYIVTTGKTTVSGTANLTGANTSATGGTIAIWGGSGTAVRLDIQGGTITNTSTGTTANAIYNASTGAVSITGGTVSTSASTGNYAVNNARATDPGVVTIGAGATIIGNTTGVTAP